MNHSLTFERSFGADPEAVFAAWSSSDALAAWFGPGSIQCEVTEFDFKVGGKYRLVMRGSGEWWLSGQFTAIEGPRHLAFTWKWDHEDEVTQLEVGIEPTEGGSQLTVVHSGFDDEKSAADHDEGWTATWPCLAEHLA